MKMEKDLTYNRKLVWREEGIDKNEIYNFCEGYKEFLSLCKTERECADFCEKVAKENNLHNKRLALSVITKEAVVKKLFDEIAPKYADKNGGYTRVLKIGPRRGDAAEMAIIELL